MSGVLCAGSVAAQDTITFDNGNVLTARIKRFEQGEMTLDVPFADGDVFVDYSRIVLIESRRVFQFRTSDGVRFLARIQPETDPEGGTMVVEYGGVTRTYERDDIVLIVETVGQFSGLLKIATGAGLTLAKSNDQRQFNADASFSYETTTYGFSATANSIFTRQRDADDVNRQSADLRASRNVGRRWSLTAINTYLTNNEQDLALRTILGAGPSYTVTRDRQLEIDVLGGMAWNHERYFPEAEQDTLDSLEGLAGINLSFFRFKQWELNSLFLVFPSLSDPGRVRTGLTAQLRLRLIRGQPFWWNVSQTLDTDNRPPEDTAGTDYVTTTTISWSFP